MLVSVLAAILDSNSLFLSISSLIFEICSLAAASSLNLPLVGSPLCLMSLSISELRDISKPGCPSQCGDIPIPYPFGIGPNSSCSLNPFFSVHCDSSFSPPKPFLSLNTTLQISHISDSTIHLKNRVAVNCYHNSSEPPNIIQSFMNLSGSPFAFSSSNKITAVGCDDVAFLSRDFDDWTDMISSCVAICSKPGELRAGSCSGIGCCEAAVPEGLQSVYVSMETINAHDKVRNFSSCGYAFLAEAGGYGFNVTDVWDPLFVGRVVESVPVVVDWVIGERSCFWFGETVCQGNSVCVDSGLSLGGYRCSCSPGYQGNPYLSPGCRDINECENSKPCHKYATCTNLQGSFNCSCPLHYVGDGTNHGTGCIYVSPPPKLAVYAASGAGLLLFITPLFIFWSYKILKKRSIKQKKHILFKRNTSLLLHQQNIPGHGHAHDKLRTFTSKELEKATDRFNSSRILGCGGQGTVYKGMLSDGRLVAVKKSKHTSHRHLKDFINELALQSEINHRNVVKLLGCCLETEVPLLVYEFVPNGTLHDLIHDPHTGIPFTWEIRLRIATEVANALAYIHCATSVPIYHRDMKSSNILLDERYRAKLSDFGISRSPAVDRAQVTTKVQGTFGYLDPEYFQTGKLTEKSDVYSFGVVLVELLTGQKPIEMGLGEEEEMSLVTRFLGAMEENRLRAILDHRIADSAMDELAVVADVAKRCLSLNGKKRPKIREVVMELESIGSSDENPSLVESSFQDISFADMDDSWTRSAEFLV
ncbi:wall-associated receptor kinase-like 8 [Salvia hispanica]|uniref:wall-associated receptor kinase-like 8 n=1 Tax=Salvia hispanica TaxID=49212 RepID=UPI00200949F4|nr:wall-associated receptor kinase-like 8 [Salvia hispanica]